LCEANSFYVYAIVGKWSSIYWWWCF